MERLDIETKTRSYSVFIDKGIRKRVPDYVMDVPSAYFVITDDQVGKFYLNDVTQSLKNSSPVFSYVVPSGESSKSFAIYKTLIDECVRFNLDRRAVIIALGGGVIGDLAGFVASTYLRGIGYIQMPTTLLAHDSSVGGKVGINHEQGKNLIGAFYPPMAVLYDTETLSTLSLRDWRGGFVEMAKHALLSSNEFFEGLYKTFAKESDLTIEKVEPWLASAIAVKAKIVSQDEKETGNRAILNLGHTLGHAIEKEMGYGQLNHGEAVAVGIIFALNLSERVLHSRLPIHKIESWFRSLGLPTGIPDSIDRKKLVERMYQDKKRRSNELVFILLKNVGDAVIETVPESIVISELQDF
jgi:3-dehydroquinate synthase